MTDPTPTDIPDGPPLQQYIHKVLELLNAEGRPAPTPAELAGLAHQMGISADDRGHLDRLGHESLTRGLAVLEKGLPADAVPDLETAAGLRPHDVETLHALAAARAAIAITQRSVDDDRRARQLVRRTLDLDPRHKSSFELLDRLDAHRPPRGGKAAVAGDRRLFGILGAVAVVITVAVLVVLAVRPSGVDTLNRRPTPNAAGPASEAPLAPNGAGTSGTGGSADEPTERLFPLADAPVSIAAAGAGRQPGSLELDPDMLARGLGGDVKDAWFNRFPDRTYFNAWVLIRNDSKEDVTTLQIESQYLDDKGLVLKSQQHFPVISTSEPLRPGDTVPVQLVSEVPASTVGARIKIEKVETRPAEATADPKAVDLQWLVPRPTGVELALTERRVESTPNSEGGIWHRVVLSLQNKGTVPLRALTLNVMRYDAHDALRQADAVTVSWRHQVPLFVGETRTLSSLEAMPVPITRYAVQVTAAAAGGVDDNAPKAPKDP